MMVAYAKELNTARVTSRRVPAYLTRRDADLRHLHNSPPPLLHLPPPRAANLFTRSHIKCGNYFVGVVVHVAIGMLQTPSENSLVSHRRRRRYISIAATAGGFGNWSQSATVYRCLAATSNQLARGNCRAAFASAAATSASTARDGTTTVADYCHLRHVVRRPR